MKSEPREKTNQKTNQPTTHPTQRHWHEMNRKQRRETMRKIQSEEIIDLLFVHLFPAKLVPILLLGSSRSISSRERIAARVPLCRKRSAKVGSRKRRGMRRSSTCAKDCFA